MLQEMTTHFKRGSIYHIKVENFKGIVDFSISPHPKTNFIFGGNGSGKSSLLTAIRWCLSTTEKTDYSVIRKGEQHCYVELQIVESHEYEQPFFVSFKKVITNKKTEFKIDGKLVTKSDYEARVTGFFVDPDSIIQFMEQHVADKLAKDGNEIRLQRILKLSVPEISEALTAAKQIQQELMQKKSKKISDSLKFSEIMEKKDSLKKFKENSEECDKAEKEIKELEKELILLNYDISRNNYQVYHEQKKRIEEELTIIKQKIAENQAKISDIEDKLLSTQRISSKITNDVNSFLNGPVSSGKNSVANISTFLSPLQELIQADATTKLREKELKELDEQITSIESQSLEINKKIREISTEKSAVELKYKTAADRHNSEERKYRDASRLLQLVPKKDETRIMNLLRTRCRNFNVDLQALIDGVKLLKSSPEYVPPLIYFGDYSPLCVKYRLQNVADFMVSKTKIGIIFATTQENKPLKDRILSCGQRSFFYRNLSSLQKKSVKCIPPQLSGSSFICTSYDLFSSNSTSLLEKFFNFLDFSIFMKCSENDFVFPEIPLHAFGIESESNLDLVYLITERNEIIEIKRKFSPKNRTFYESKRKLNLKNNSFLLDNSLVQINKEIIETYEKELEQFNSAKSFCDESEKTLLQLKLNKEDLQEQVAKFDGPLNEQKQLRDQLSKKKDELKSRKSSLSSFSGSSARIKNSFLSQMASLTQNMSDGGKKLSSFDFSELRTLRGLNKKLKAFDKSLETEKITRKNLQLELHEQENFFTQVKKENERTAEVFRENLDKIKRLKIFDLPAEDKKFADFMKQNFSKDLEKEKEERVSRKNILTSKLTHSNEHRKKAAEFDALVKEAESLADTLGSLDDSIKTLDREFHENLDFFVANLRQNLEKVNTIFSEYLKKFKTRGYCELLIPKITEDNTEFLDLEKCGIAIKTSFREGVDPGESSNSGGENAYSSLCFSMALSQISKYPFRIVDEIDQGLDDLNIRKVQLLLFEAEDIQYFIGTPKLTDALYFGEDMKLHVIMPCNLNE